ncbi:sensor histidine kinase [Paenibacillus sp. YN15]|uniref:sensor histidine kinase n=1 Tax=Paenibacillus sp. YN15 TaxID=1742774 RepID=UPI000DCD1FAB|nr:sensor histidine kinase [Paenibacillus sp. YN15]RAV00539.1 sensor histidine kinase [Paenibacillus sp. YN15]
MRNPFTAFRPSLKLKLLAVLAAISIIPVALASQAWYRVMLRSSIAHSENISSQYARFVAGNITAYLKSVSQALDPLLTDPSFQHYLQVPKEEIVTQAGLALQFRPQLQSLLKAYPELLGVLYMDSRGKVMHESYQKSIDYAYDFQADSLFGRLGSVRLPVLSSMFSTAYMLGAPENGMALTRPVNSLLTGRTEAWLLVEIRAEYLRRLLTPPRDGEGRLLLYHTGSGAAILDDVDGPPLSGELRRAVAKAAAGGKEQTFTEGDLGYELAVQDLAFGDWRLVLVTPLEELTRGVRESQRWTLVIAGLSLLAGAIIAFPVMGLVTRPLTLLTRSMRTVATKGYQPLNITAGQDEIGYLIRSYNGMLADLEQMKHEVYEAQLREKERELLQLQAQINPHFLFNTLETIDSYAGRDNSAAVGDMVQSVARMMRYNVRQDGGWATLGEELAYIRHFLNIHRYRNGTEVACPIEVEPELLGMPVMKLSIQPFVENALKYGWSPRMKPGEFALHLSAARESGKLRIIVDNNGEPMSREVLDKLELLVAGDGVSGDDFFASHTGIHNVFRRLYLAYGSSARLSFSAGGGGKGTRVELLLPLHEGSRMAGQQT